jgi:tripartite-type tricarboxylate transporter receptor subunit TctC
MVKKAMRSYRLLWLALVAVAGSFLTHGNLAAQTYPTRTLTIVVPFAAGGPTDTIARIVADRMRVSLGQPIVIENAPGAAGTVSIGRVVRAAPDGYTLSLGPSNSHVFAGAIHTLTFDTLKDLAPVALLATNPSVIVSKNAVPASNLAELVVWVKANQDKVSAGTSGPGSGTHIGGLLFQSLTGTRFPFVSYRGAGPAMQDMVAGQIDLMFDQISNSIAQVRGGQIKAYGVMSANRSPAAPDIPTVNEAGLPGLHMSIWHGLWAPKGTPKDVIDRLNSAVAETLADAAVQKRLADIGQEIAPREQQSAEALGAFHKAETEKWWPIIKAADVKPQ